MKTLAVIILLSSFVFARFDAKPSQTCEAYNNMKHTKNTHHVVLDLSREYTVLKHHKGQNLLLIKGEQPAQRWVDDSCFSKRKTNETQTHTVKPTTNTVNIKDELLRADKSMAKNPQKSKKYVPNKRSTSKQNLLALSWHNAFCETHRYKKECKRGLGSLLKRKSSDSQFVLHGLWPQPRSNVYCNVDYDLKKVDKKKHWRDLPCLALDEKVEDALAKVMPGFSSDLHKHEWIKHGTCYGKDENRYYADAISLIDQVNSSALGKFFTQNIGKKISLKQVRTIADKSFGRGAGNRIELQCKKGLITELWLHLGSGGTDLKTLLAKGKKTNSRCKQGRIDKAGFGR